jgi:hypothetical protein
MSDVHRPAQQEPSDAVFKSPQQDVEGVEPFGDEPTPTPPVRPSPAATPKPTPAPRPAPAPRPQPAPPRRAFSVFWPIVLIGAGVVLFLANIGYLPDLSWNVLWRLWPLLLIGMGLDALIGRRSTFGAVVATLLILAMVGGVIALLVFAPQIPAVIQWAQPVGWESEHIESPLADAREARVAIDWTSLPGRLRALEDSPNLIEADVAYRGRLIFDVEERGQGVAVRLDQDRSGAWFGPIEVDASGLRWDVRLSPRVPIELTLDGGSGSGEYNLTGLQIQDLYLDVGSGSIELTLPAAGGYEARIDGGSGSLDIVLPRNVGARVELDSGSGSFRPDDRFRLVRGERNDDGVWETDPYDPSDRAITLKIDQTSGSIRIR